MRKFFLLIMFLLFNLPMIVHANDLTIMPIDYVNGDAAVLESNGEYLLVDVGFGEDDTVIEYLDQNGIKKFDLYLSHYDGDHFGSGSGHQINVNGESKTVNLMHYIMSLNGSKYTIENIYIPAIVKRDSSEEYLEEEQSLYNRHDYFVKAAALYDINCVELQTGNMFIFGNTKAEVLYLNTDATVYSARNNSSLVTMFTNGKVKFLTAGDIEEYTENEILSKGINISADIYKMSHHGGYTVNHKSNTPAFLKKVNPKYTYAQFRWSMDAFWNANGFNAAALGNGYYLVDETSQIRLSDISNVYSNFYSDVAEDIANGAKTDQTKGNGRIKFVIENNEITPVIETLDGNGKTITINYVDAETNEVLKTRKFDFSLRNYVVDGSGNQNTYHLYDYKETFQGYTLDSGEDLIQTDGTVTENLTYEIKYKKNIYTLTVRHVDEDGNILLADQVISQKYNTPYSTTANNKLLDEYTLIEEPSNAKGVVSKNETITYRYKTKNLVVEVPNTFQTIDSPIISLIMIFAGISIILYVKFKEKTN